MPLCGVGWAELLIPHDDIDRATVIPHEGTVISQRDILIMFHFLGFKSASNMLIFSPSLKTAPGAR